MAAVHSEIFAGDVAAPSAGVIGERYDSYLPVHKALRALAADTLVKLGKLDPDDDDETRSVLAQVRQAIEFGQMHLAKEETFVHPAMEARAPGSTQRAAADHVSHSGAFERILAACRDVEASRGKARAAAALCLYRRYAVLMAEDLVHMNTEETENNAVLWATYTDAELVDLTDRLVGSIPGDVLARYVRWMVTANAPRDRAKLLADIRRKAPAHGFAMLLDGVLPHLSEPERQKLLQALA